LMARPVKWLSPKLNWTQSMKMRKKRSESQTLASKLAPLPNEIPIHRELII
jgi:hypothetical protein